MKNGSQNIVVEAVPDRVGLIRVEKTKQRWTRSLKTAKRIWELNTEKNISNNSNSSMSWLMFVIGVIQNSIYEKYR